MQEPVTATIDSETPARAIPFAAAILAFTAGAIVYCAFIAGYTLNHDAGVMLQVGDIMLHGGVPYRDIIEITPPIAPALHIIPILMSKLTTLSQAVAFHVSVTLLVLFACWQLWFLLGLENFGFSRARRMLFLAAWLSGTLCVQLAIDYGQREHLFAIVLLPWVLCRIARYDGARPPLPVSISLGMVASPFLLQKPFFLLVIAGIEVILLIRARTIRRLISIETISLIAWGAVYFIYLLTLPQDAREELRFLIQFLSQHYGAYDGNFFDEENSYSYKWIAGVVLISIAMLRLYSPRARFQLVVLIATVALCFAIYLLQGKGWLYHQIPARMATTALLAFAIACPRSAEAMQRSKPLLRRMVTPGCIAFLCMSVFYFFIAWHSQRTVRADYVRAMTDKILQYAGPGDSVTFISSDLRWGYPAVIYAGVNLGSRYDIDFMIPMLYHDVKGNPQGPFRYRTPSEQSDIERRYLQRRAEDVERFRPKLIAIDTHASAQALPKGFRVSEYFESNGWNETVLKNYERAEVYFEFQLYLRKDAP